MIAYIRGRLDGVAAAPAVPIRTKERRIVARTFSPPGTLAPDDDVVAASATIAVGVVDRDETALLGPWPADGPDPAGPRGLASRPVVLLADASTIDVTLVGVARAGREPGVAMLEAGTSGLGLELLAAVGAGAEVVVLTEAEGRHIDLVRILGGRAVVALPTSNATTIAAWFGDAELGADIPLPTTDAQASADVAGLGLEAVHQLVQVDPGPALDQANVRAASFGVLVAAAAGVLAGRIVVGNRRWRAEVEP
jgi:hypothetical protein